MASTDLVPCFYTGQNYRAEKPAKVHSRAQVHEFKKQLLGKFVENGKIFLFAQATATRKDQVWDGPMGVGNLLPFAKPNSSGDKLHYEMPHAGDLGMRRYGLFTRRDDKGIPQLHTRELLISGRPRFNFQVLPDAGRTSALGA